MLGPGLFLLLVCTGSIVAGAWIASRDQPSPPRLAGGPCGIPRTKIADYPRGDVGRIVGTVSTDVPPLIAPLTGRPCAAYEVIVNEYIQGERSWRTVVHQAEGRPFLVDDGTGRARVDPTGARLTLSRHHETRSGVVHPASPTETAFLALHGEPTKRRLCERVFEFREAVVELGQFVAVMGRGTAPEPIDPTAELMVRAGPQVSLSITDHPSTLT